MTTLFEAFRRLPPGIVSDPVLRARARAAADAEAAAAKRRIERKTLGCCPCGFVTGEAHCPFCDGDAPQGLRALVVAGEMRRTANGRLDVATITKLAVVPARQETAPGTRAPNRHERRVAAARRGR